MEIKILNWLIRFFTQLKTNIETLLHELKFMKYEMQFGERDDDIYVATFLKSGTTWMQMILYQLTTPGEINFNHIYDVSPWLRNLADRDGTIPELTSPRIIKTHDPYPKFKKGRKGRFIFIIRDGRDVALSLYHHRKNYNNFKITFEENFDISFRYKDQMNWFEFNRQWLENSNKHNILYVKYEDLQTNFVYELFRIAEFLGIELKNDDVARIQERSSFAFMKKHEEKFGERRPEEKHEIVYNQFIRSGKVGEGNLTISDADFKFFNEQFNFNLARFELMKAYKNEIETEAARRAQQSNSAPVGT